MDCLAAVDRSATDTLWLHSGVAMGYGEDKGLDMYQLLRASAANEALKLLDFKAMVSLTLRLHAPHPALRSLT